MAEVYKFVSGAGGGRIQKVIARHETVQDALDFRALRVGTRAEGLLNQKRVDRHADIEVEDFGHIDRYVTLSDERGLKAAMSIEYGRAPGKGHPGSEGRFILHEAFGLEARSGRGARRTRGGRST